eukprot:SAG11_NODE_2124_length_3784_cov_1.668657_2_plen_98_part_00
MSLYYASRAQNHQECDNAPSKIDSRRLTQTGPVFQDAVADKEDEQQLNVEEQNSSSKSAISQINSDEVQYSRIYAAHWSSIADFEPRALITSCSSIP